MGFALLVSGWALVLSALVLLTSAGQRLAFVIAGIAVQVLGLHLIGSAYKVLQSSPKQSGAAR